jgi:hypothetical protein
MQVIAIHMSFCNQLMKKRIRRPIFAKKIANPSAIRTQLVTDEEIYCESFGGSIDVEKVENYQRN